MLKFDWDPKKNESNYKKHKIDFEEAKTIFDDPFALVTEDRDHSIREFREKILGKSLQYRLLSVIFTERKEGTIRIISARLATSFERKYYEKQR